MISTFAMWLLIVLSLIFANLPFVNQRLFLFGKKFHSKPFSLRLLEWLCAYFFLGLLAAWLENRMGNRFTQHWEFYAITLCLFVVLAFPGFVLRYLIRQRHRS